MAPNSSKYYPITGLTESLNPKECLPHTLPVPFHVNSLTSLAKLGTKWTNAYLKEVIHNLKSLLKVFPEVNISMKLPTTVHSTQATHVFTCKVTTQQIGDQQPTMLDALWFLNKLFFLSHALLKNVQELCNTQRIDGVEINILTKLKELLLKLTGLLDRILVFYSDVNSISSLPSLKEVKCCTKKLGEVIGNMNSQQLCQLIPSITEEDVLCSVLGLQENVARRLSSLSSQIRNHQSDKYFLLQFLTDHGENCECDEGLRNSEAVASKLQEIGFTENRSMVVADWIAKQPLAEHQSLLAWVQHYIESLFTYNIFLNNHVSRYPYRETKLNSWFSVAIEREKKDDDDDDDGVETTNVKIINTTPEKVTKLIKEEQMHQLNSCFYYHGTNHKSAKSILEEGIKLQAGKRNCDFSDGNGFYLTDNSIYALKWAEVSKAHAVLIFNVSDDCLDNYHCLDLTPDDRKSDYQRVKNHYRKNDKLPRNLKKECGKCHYIKGPISRDGVQEMPQQDTQQICIKKEDMADCIGNATNIHGVIFINAD